MVTALPTLQQPAWLLRTLWVLIVVGFLASIYLLVQFSYWIASPKQALQKRACDSGGSLVRGRERTFVDETSTGVRPELRGPSQ